MDKTCFCPPGACFAMDPGPRRDGWSDAKRSHRCKASIPASLDPGPVLFLPATDADVPLSEPDRWLLDRAGAAVRTLMGMGYDYIDGAERWSPPIGKAPAFTAPDLLAAAEGHMRARAATYDKPEGERSMGATVAAWNAITGRQLTESEGWMLLVLLKLVRDRQSPAAHRDSIEDGIAYAALAGEARLAGR